MSKFNCFSVIVGRKKKVKDDEVSKALEFNQALNTLKIRLQQPVKPFENDELKSSTFGVAVPLGVEKNSSCNIKVISHGSPVVCEPAEAAYEGEDEHEEISSVNRNLSDFDLKAHEVNLAEEIPSRKSEFFNSPDTELNEQFDKITEKDGGREVDMIQSGHVSDPGIKMTEFWASPNLKRSCSNLETTDMIRMIGDQLPPSKSQSFEELQGLAERMGKDYTPGSPRSVLSHHSADKVMLKKRSSRQVLPSRSRRIWWKLFLWSHRNLHRPGNAKEQTVSTSAVLNRQGGYYSDNLEPNRATQFSKMESPGSFTGESLIREHQKNEIEEQNWDVFQHGVSSLWPQNQWLAFPAESSPFARVEEWVKHLEPHPSFQLDDDNNDEGIVFPNSPEKDKSQPRFPSHSTPRLDVNLPEDVLHANSVIQSLNSTSTVAHISGIGLKAVPNISSFSSLRTVNLSSNFIVHITPGSLPKGLHSLDLSRNKISTIEGLRELTRLRVLDLSYNRISRIGHGLSNCQLIKELYLAGNKISDVEGLHRLLKLTVLDLSFNKITTTKALGQLVANYNSLQAMNLLGNPIQNNISDEQLRKAVCGLLPKLVYLNKQVIKPQRAREVLTDSVAKAALGNNGYNARRKAGRRISQVGSSSTSAHRSSTSVAHKSRHKSKSRAHHQTSQLKASPAIASSSR
ncbi:hypothetical protein UlMin_035194 [Ulmus minor]